jgi:hypothetical protein
VFALHVSSELITTNECQGIKATSLPFPESGKNQKKTARMVRSFLPPVRMSVTQPFMNHEN